MDNVAGWVEPRALSIDARQRIVTTLASARGRAFRDAANRESILGAIDSAITRYHATSKGVSLARTKDRAERVRDHARKLRVELARWSESDADLADTIAGEDGVFAEALASVSRLETVAADLADAGRMSRGPTDPSPGHAMRALIFTVAQAWRHAFGREASPEPSGVFARALAIVADEVGAEPPGKDALRAILRP